jgi:hypothetical protein
MGKTLDFISTDLQSWIEKQKIFFVATAPLSESGHINLSPKGLDSFRIITPTLIAYQDLTGSGVETIAHINENKRIVIMFCAFEGPPKIIRLYGKGEVVLPGDERFEELNQKFPQRTGTRAYILSYISGVLDSCGWGVPLYEFKSDRDALEKWSDVKGVQGVEEYRSLKNRESLDGLKGL